MRSFYNGICIIACLAITACHKDKNAETVKQLTAADAGTTTAVTKGETISLTLGNPGDGGYQLNDPQYKTSVLTLVSHTHQDGSNAVGDFGKDTWKFTANGTGTTILEITASRGTPGAEKISLFSNQITVK
jgi:predicted secreted protein